MSDESLPQSEIILYQTEDGRTRIQCRFENETLWLTQALIAELFEKDVRTINEYLVKGFTMDDERLKNPPGKGQKDYFDEQLERIRDIRSSERRFYQKVLDIYATSVDYTPNTEISQQFFATVQNKMHWAAHGQTAAELEYERYRAFLDSQPRAVDLDFEQATKDLKKLPKPKKPKPPKK